MNKVILIGRVGKDPEIKVFNSGDKIVNFTIATSERWTTKQGEKKESTEWHNIVASKNIAELCEKHVLKGSKLMVVGKIKQRSWDSDNGKKYITEIHISEIEFLSKKIESDDNLIDLNSEQIDDLPF